ncbi:hypothetical protein BH10BAC2_BH10BAC2_03680 [soil metagenome]
MLTTSKSLSSFRLLRKVVLVLLLPLAVLSGCKVQLVPVYSAELENQIIEGAKMTDMLYMEMIDAPADKRSYDLYAEKYRAIEAEINSILLKNETRAKAEDMVASVKQLREGFVNARNEHKAKTTLSDPELIILRETFKAFWKPVLIEEHVLASLKE